MRQSEPTEAILLPGSAWASPYAPEEALVALMFQPLSWLMMLLNAAY